jgi:hypothetical protein
MEDPETPPLIAPCFDRPEAKAVQIQSKSLLRVFVAVLGLDQNTRFKYYSRAGE